MESTEINYFGLALVFSGFLLIALIIVVILFKLPALIQALVIGGFNARTHIDAMHEDPNLYRDNRFVAYVIFYLISWIGYIAFLIGFISGIWVIYSAIKWIRKSDDE